MIDIEEGEWAQAEVEVVDGHVALSVSEESALLLTPKMARALAKRLKQCADQCVWTTGGGN